MSLISIAQDSPQKVAVVGMACRFSDAENPAELWKRFIDSTPDINTSIHPGENVQKIGAAKVSYAQFNIPPIYRDSINQIQLHLLELAQQALIQAGLEQCEIDTEFTDVIF